MADAREERGEAVEVVLAPDLERVVMALRTFEPHAEKQLADGGADLDGRRAIAIEDRRPLAKRVALRRDQLAHELVVRHVAAEGVSQPRIQIPDGLDPDSVRIGTQEIGPLVRPEVGVLGPLQKLIDEECPLVGTVVGKERAGLIGRRQATDHSQERPSVKGRVGRVGRREHPHQLELFPDEAVDLIESRECVVGRVGDGSRQRDRDRADGDVTHVSRHDRGLTGKRPGLNLSLAVNGHDGAVVRLEGGAIGDIAPGTVGVFRDRFEREALLRDEAAIRWLHDDTDDLGRIGRSARGTAQQPRTDEFIVRRSRREPGSAAMRNLAGRFPQQEARRG